MGFLPDRSRVVFRHLLERHASERPDEPAVLFEDGTSWTWQDALDESYRAANVIRDQGVARGDRVVILAANGPGWLRAWWGVNAVGGVMVPLNPTYKGTMLQHVVRDAEAALVLADDDLAARIEEVEGAPPVLPVEKLTEGMADEPPLDQAIEPWDVFTVNYTSGTTGPSKGALTPYLLISICGMEAFNDPFDMTPDDRVLCDLPLFHLGGQVLSASALTAGCSLAVRTVFSGTSYWDVVRETGSTVTQMVGTMGAFLTAQDGRPDDADHPMRAVWCTPPPPDPDGFRERFGIDDMRTGFGMTEAGLVMMTPSAVTDPRTAGRPRPGIEARLVDEHDVPVGPGEVGELIVRTSRPWELMVGYHGRPEDTARAWRNGWLHTGDAFRVDEDGNHYFVDRFKDALRRRGENISSFEVEREVAAFPDVAEAACVAAPGDYGDDEVKVFVVAKQGASLDPAALVEFLVPRMPYFMVPRYVEVVDELPKTPTMRVKKFELRARGNTAATWDREAAGIDVRRDA